MSDRPRQETLLACLRSEHRFGDDKVPTYAADLIEELTTSLLALIRASERVCYSSLTVRKKKELAAFTCPMVVSQIGAMQELLDETRVAKAETDGRAARSTKPSETAEPTTEQPGYPTEESTPLEGESK